MTTPAPAACVQGITASGETLPFSLPGGGIQVTAAFSMVSGSEPSLTAYADFLDGAEWVEVCALDALTEAGYQQATGQAPVSGPPGWGQWRLRWTVTGAAPLFSGLLAAAGC